jgi:hypothetical protein
MITAEADAPEVQLDELVMVKVYVSADKPLNVTVGPVPVRVVPPGNAVTVQLPVEGNPLKATLPVTTAQVGCVMVTIIGVGGGEESIKMALTPVDEVQPLTVICKLLYVPTGAKIVAVPPDTTTPVKLPEV